MDPKNANISISCINSIDSSGNDVKNIEHQCRVNTRALPTGQLQQILSLSIIPSVSVNPALLDEARTALREREYDSLTNRENEVERDAPVQV